MTGAASERHHSPGHAPGAPRSLSRYLCPSDRRGIDTNVSEAGLVLLEQARPTSDEALREALTRAAIEPGLAPLVRAISRMSLLVEV